jgi:hypothetical protein
VHEPFYYLSTFSTQHTQQEHYILVHDLLYTYRIRRGSFVVEIFAASIGVSAVQLGLLLRLLCGLRLVGQVVVLVVVARHGDAEQDQKDSGHCCARTELVLGGGLLRGGAGGRLDGNPGVGHLAGLGVVQLRSNCLVRVGLKNRREFAAFNAVGELGRKGIVQLIR